MRGCGFAHPPPEDSPDREAVDVFTDWLRESAEVGIVPGTKDHPGTVPDTPAAKAFMVRWGPYMSGSAPGPV